MKRYLLALALAFIAVNNASAQHKPHLLQGEVTARIDNRLINPTLKTPKTSMPKTVIIGNIVVNNPLIIVLPAPVRQDADNGYRAVVNGKVIARYASVDRATLYALQTQANLTGMTIVIYRGSDVINAIQPKKN